MDPNAVILADLAEDPKYTLQLVLNRKSTQDFCIVDASLWSYFSPDTSQDERPTETSNVLLCPHCHGVVLSEVCTACMVLVKPADAFEGITIHGGYDYVAAELANIYSKLGFNADILCVFLPVGFEETRDLRGLSWLPLDDLLAQGEHKLYARGTLSSDTKAGASLHSCIRAFLHA